MRRIRVFLAIVVSISHIGDAESQVPEYSIEHLTIDHGLPQNEVTAIIQDKRGFMWFGTRGGLARFDGYDMKVFQFEPGNKKSLSNNSIEALLESSDGKIWIGTKSGGLNCFDPFQETFTHYLSRADDPESISGDGVAAIAETQDGKIWLGTNMNGLNRFDPATGKFDRLLGTEQIFALACSGDGTLWISTGNELFQIVKGSQIPVNTRLGLPEDMSLTSIVSDEEQRLLFLSGWEAGLIVYDVEQKKIIRHVMDPLPSPGLKRSNNLYSLFQDKKSKQLWMGFWGDGLKCFDPNLIAKRVFIAPHSEGKYNTDYDIVLKIFGDRSGNIWIGTDGGGVCKLSVQKNLFKSYTFENSGLSSGHVLSILEDKKGRVWIGTKGGGLNELRGNKVIHHTEIFDRIRDVKANDIHTIYEDINGDLWFGSNFGLHRITKIIDGKILFETFTHERNRKNSLSQEKVMAILRDRVGRLWVGTQGQGLNRLIDYGENGLPNFKTYKADQKNPFSLAGDRISILFEDSKGRLWVGTYKGLHLYKEEIDGFIKICHEPGSGTGLSNDIVTCIAEDPDGNIWAGTAGGLNKIVLNNDVLTAIYFTRKNGLPNDYINSILFDARGNLWIGSNRGIFKFNAKNNQIHLFNVSDGLQGNAFSENAACIGSNGLMYFGGINGFNVFDPLREVMTVPSPLTFISLKVMGEEVRPGAEINGRKILDRSISYTKNISLTHLDKVLTVEVSSLDFTLPEKNQYSFKLEGFDQEWSNFQHTRTVTYTNLKAGNYTLLARAGDTGNVWVGDPIALQITVLPAPWETWWAYTLYCLAVVLIVYIIRAIEKKHMRLKDAVQAAGLEKLKEKEISEMKFRFFTNVSHELKTPLTLILSPLEELLTLKDVSKHMREKLLLMHRHSGRLLTLIHQLLDLRKAESGNMRLLVEERDMIKFVFGVFESFNHLAERRKISYNFYSEISHLLLGVDENKMEMAITNILSNAFKYTPDGGSISCNIAIKRDVSLNQSFCIISVQDTGRGMPKDSLDKIFDLYYQVAVVDSVKISGTGIGLSLVKEIVQLHGGLVTVESAIGKGSEFSIKLPLKTISTNSETRSVSETQRENILAEAISRKETAEDERPLLLIIEDTDELRNYVANLLHDEFHVLQASSGEDGLKCAFERIPDIIISDVMMGTIDGFEVCNQVKNNIRTSHIPVVLLTAKNMPENELSGLSAGADDYIKKPFNPIILIARVRRLLESRKQLKEYYSKKVTLQPTNVEITPYDEKFLQKAMTYIEANLLDPNLSAESLGNELAMSHSTLYRKIKALTGQSIHEFMRSIRIKRAAQLLETGQYTVSEAAFQTGFSEVKYFRGYFKDQFNCLPSEYAKAKKEEII